MKNLIFTLSFFFGMNLIANAEGGIYLSPLLSNDSPSHSSFIETMNNFPDYSCKVRVKLSLTWGAGISAECEGGGTSKTSASKACNYAYEALASCMQHAANYGFRRDTPKAVPMLPRYGEW